MLRPLDLFHPGIGVSGSYLGITARFRRGEQKNHGRGAPPKDRPESPESAVYPCGTGEHCWARDLFERARTAPAVGRS